MELASLDDDQLRDDGSQDDGSNRHAPTIAASQQHGTAHFIFFCTHPFLCER